MKMLQQGVQRDVENSASLHIKKTNQNKGLKQRSKALSDVKNTLHAHSSNANDGKKNKKPIGEQLGKGSTMKPSSKTEVPYISNSVSSKKRSLKFKVSDSENDFDFHDHSACEKGNSIEYECFKEYRLTRNELNIFGNSMNIFRVNPFPLKVEPAPSPLDDLEIAEVERHYASDEDDVPVKCPDFF